MKSLILFASGQGSNAKAIINYFETNPEVSIDLIVCNNPNAGVIQMAKQEGIPLMLITKNSWTKPDFLNKLVLQKPDLIVLAGFLWKIPTTLVQAFQNKIINLHPALLPKYGGKGMYGMRVHEAVKAAGEAESGITIHWVNEDYDEGSILVQAHCRVLQKDTPEEIANRIHHLEHHFLPRTIEFLLNNPES